MGCLDTCFVPDVGSNPCVAEVRHPKFTEQCPAGVRACVRLGLTCLCMCTYCRVHVLPVCVHVHGSLCVVVCTGDCATPPHCHFPASKTGVRRTESGQPASMRTVIRGRNSARGLLTPRRTRWVPLHVWRVLVAALPMATVCGHWMVIFGQSPTQPLPHHFRATSVPLPPRKSPLPF